jgi:Na+/glutamate symporter
MNILPVQNYQFDLVDSQTETLDRLKRRTEISDKLTSKITGKSFVGKINQNKFHLLPANISKGTFCTLQGVLYDTKGEVEVEINKNFKIILYIFLCLPLLGFFAQFFSGQEKFNPIFILVCIGQILVIRYFFIGIYFWMSSKIAVTKLAEVLDAENIRKK